MEDKELFELCKSVYEKTGWTRTHKVWHEDTLTSPIACGYEDVKHAIHFIPLYTSDYLLEKLPDFVTLRKVLKYMPQDDSTKIQYQAMAEDDDFETDYCDDPRIALLKLTLALHEAGEL